MAPAQSCPHAARRARRSALPALLGAGALAWCSSYLLGRGFVTAGLPLDSLGAARSRPAGSVARRAFAFDVAEKEEYDGLVTEEDEDSGNRLVYTKGAFPDGNWNTVLGDTEVPNKGKSYWEVKVVKKPLDNWEYIGVSEPSCEVEKPISKNKKGMSWFWGGNWDSTFTYYWQPELPSFKADAKAWVEMKMKDAIEEGFPEKLGMSKVDELVKMQAWGTKGFTCGINMETSLWPRIKQGMVIGVEVDMDAGTLGYYADGKYLGLVKDSMGKPVDLKGKKLVPAVSVWGRTNAEGDAHGTVLEFRTGVEPPTA